MFTLQTAIEFDGNILKIKIASAFDKFTFTDFLLICKHNKCTAFFGFVKCRKYIYSIAFSFKIHTFKDQFRTIISNKRNIFVNTVGKIAAEAITPDGRPAE